MIPFISTVGLLAVSLKFFLYRWLLSVVYSIRLLTVYLQILLYDELRNERYLQSILPFPPSYLLSYRCHTFYFDMCYKPQDTL